MAKKVRVLHKNVSAVYQESGKWFWLHIDSESRLTTSKGYDTKENCLVGIREFKEFKKNFHKLWKKNEKEVEKELEGWTPMESIAK